MGANANSQIREANRAVRSKGPLDKAAFGAVFSALLTVLLLAGIRASVPATAAPVVEFPTFRYVAPTGTDAGDCLNSVNPCRTIQYAVDQAGQGDEIRVAGGRYTALTPQVVFLTKSIIIRGGYSVVNWGSPDPESNPTIVDGGGVRRGLYVTGISTPTIEHLQFIRGAADFDGGAIFVVTATATLSGNVVLSSTAHFNGGGITIRSSASRLINNRVAGNSATGNGGGIELTGSGATLVGNTVTGNSAGATGGGIDVFASAAILERNVVSGNVAFDGGGIKVFGSGATLIQNVVAGNRSGDTGGGIDLFQSNAILRGNQFLNNVAAVDGGGVDLYESSATLDGEIIRANAATKDGGGVRLYASDATIHNIVVIGNEAASGSGISAQGGVPRILHATIADNRGEQSGIRVSSSTGLPTSLAITNSIIISHSVGITVGAGSQVRVAGVLWSGNLLNAGGGGLISVTTAFTGVPLFASDGYHLTSASPARDRALPSGVLNDIDRGTRPQGPAPDLGADEFGAEATPEPTVGPAAPAPVRIHIPLTARFAPASW